MSRVAIVTSKGVDDPDNPHLFAALADLDLSADLVVWDDDGVAWADYDLVVIRSTWDYSARRAEFLAWARDRSRLEIRGGQDVAKIGLAEKRAMSDEPMDVNSITSAL